MAPRTILHVDMDAFFAAIEVRDNPELRGKPVLVGGAGKRGVVSAASYEAREFGCHSAQPMAVALRQCPHAIVVPPRGDAYAEVSRQVFEIFDRFSPLVEGISIDEAFLDLTGTERLLGAARHAAEALRAAVRRETALTCSVGIAGVKFIAKIASDLNKPDGLTEVAVGKEQEFLDPLPIGKLWGVGPKTRERLEGQGITTIGDLRRAGIGKLDAWFGASGVHLHQLSHSLDPRDVVPGRPPKSISHEDTYGIDIGGVLEIRRKLLSQSVRVADRLVAKGLLARKIRLKIRDGEFRTESRQRVLVRPTSETKVIYETACQLLETVDVERRAFRLTGVGVGDLVREDEDTQLDLLAGVDEAELQLARGKAVQRTLAEIRRRYGHQALFPAEAGATERVGTTGAISNTRDED